MLPRDREVPVTQAKEAAERQDRVGDPVIPGIDDNVIDRPQMLALRIDDFLAEVRFFNDDCEGLFRCSGCGVLDFPLASKMAK